MISFLTPWYTRLAIETAIFSVPALLLITNSHFLHLPFRRKAREKRRLNYSTE